MHFLSDANAEIEGLLEVNRDFCKKQMAEKASPALPTNCAVVPQAILASGQDKAIPEQSTATASSSQYGFTRGADYYGRGKSDAD